ncbi:hypothetical protein [Methylobacter sp.]|uniref:hypothetical protein n=1 Tax=Methylobacter sp. TaxID=2051955 RepID=UPI003DA24965
MEKYLYLTEPEWADAWVNGGIVPISLASSYRSLERKGTSTPDENRIDNIPVDMLSLLGLENVEHIKGLTMRNNYIGDKRLPDICGERYIEDGFILSLCNSYSTYIEAKLRKKTCVKIKDVGMLKHCIDKQLCQIGEMSPCRYRYDHQRNHFLKSSKDKWQDEYRLFWRSDNPKTAEMAKKGIMIPAGTAEPVSVPRGLGHILPVTVGFSWSKFKTRQIKYEIKSELIYQIKPASKYISI